MLSGSLQEPGRQSAEVCELTRYNAVGQLGVVGSAVSWGTLAQIRSKSDYKKKKKNKTTVCPKSTSLITEWAILAIENSFFKGYYFFTRS